jgi:presenilin-like A22 family membrane protease
MTDLTKLKIHEMNFMSDSNSTGSPPSDDSPLSFLPRPPSYFKLPRLLPSDPVMAIVVMFAITQLLAVPAGIFLLQGAQISPEVAQLSVSPTGQADDPLNAVFFVAYVLGGAVAILLTIKFYKGALLFRLLEFSVVSGSVAILLFAYLNGLTGMPFAPALLLSTMAGFMFGLAKFFIARLKNTAAILSSAGVGALFGFSMGFWPAMAFILALSLYDYIAVFRTRHMLAMAQALGTRSLSFTITAESGQSENTTQAIRAPTASLTPSTVSSTSGAAPSRSFSLHPRPSYPASHSSSHAIDRLDLGSGDLAIPAMLAVSTYTIAGLPGAIAVMIGTIVSIAVLLKFVVEKRVALPALPPICLGGLVALLIVKLLGF